MSYTWEIWFTKKEIVHRNKDGTFAKGNLHMPRKWRENMLQLRSEKHKRNMSKAHLGSKHSEEVKRKIAKARLGCKHTEKSKRKMSIIRENYWKKRKGEEDK